jgi:Protein of unknown function (DUF3037)
MQGKVIYEYAVMRLVPKVEREEFINIGIVLFSKQANYINVLTKIDINKVNALCPTMDLEVLHEYLDAFQKIAHGADDGGPIAKFDVPSRFRWLTAKRSTIIQTSPTHSGLSDNLETTIQNLFCELV